MATSTSQTAFLTMTKSFDYRGARELWSNVYHLDSTPPSSADWQELFNVAWDQERSVLPSDCQIESGTGHEAGTPPVLVWEVDAPPPGEGGSAGTWIPGAAHHAAPGDAAAWVRWGTDLKNDRGKPIYLRNYFHGVWTEINGDALADTQFQALTSLASAWQAGLVASGRTYRRSGPNHGSPQNHAVSANVTTRTLKRRGKRKKLPQSFEIMGGPTGEDFFKWFLGKVPSLIP